MLSGTEIINSIKMGDIIIEPFNQKQVNPNSYNVTLSKELSYYKEDILDCKKYNPVETINIPKEGYIILPGILYLAKTREYTESYKHIPQLSGRSSVGRVGVTVHISSGFGSIGYKGSWILGITCLKPTRIYEGMELGQIYYYHIVGDSEKKYNGKYQNKGELLISKSYKDF